MEVKRLSKHEWSKLSENAHLIVFDMFLPTDMERIDYALIATEGEKVLMYVTVQERDGETAYWQYGGAFPSAKGTVLSLSATQKILNWFKEAGYKRVTYQVENLNKPMLKLAMKLDFTIQGLRVFKDKIYLEHILEFGG